MPPARLVSVPVSHNIDRYFQMKTPRTIPRFKPTLKSCAVAALLLSSTAAFASNFYVVVPVPAKTSAGIKNINVALTGYSLPSGLVGQAYAGFDFKSLLAVTGDASYTGYGVRWSVASGSLPAGLTLNSDGTLTGTPTSGGTASFQVMATYKTKAGQQTYRIVVAHITVDLAAGTPPQALVGSAYSYDLKPLLTVTGDSAYTAAGVTWTVVSSNLPAGLYLTSDGFIGGTPTASGTGSITARASYKGADGQQTYQVLTLAIQVALASSTPAQALVGEPYSFDVTHLLSVNGDPAYTGAGVSWRIVSGSLPPGLSLSASGVVSGTPTAAATGPVVVQATYRGVNGQQTYQMVSLSISVSLAASTPPQAIVGQAYSYNLNSQLAVSGDPGFSGSGVTWDVISSSLPAGLTLSSGGLITGTPTAPGTGSVTARATYRNANGQQTYQVVTLNIVVSLSSATLPLGNVGASYSYDFKPLVSVSGDTGYALSAVQFRMAPGSSLPAGLTLGANGVLAGTPAAAATSGQKFSVVADYRGQQATVQYTVTVNPAFFDFNPTISSNTTNYNLYNAARAAGWDGVAPLRASVTVGAGVWVGASSTGNYAFVTGTGFPAQSTLKLTNNGAIVGAGGAGGSGCSSGYCSWSVGGNGGPALYAQYPITIVNNNVIGGGGGGGGGSQVSWQSSVVAGGSGGGGGEGWGTSAGGGVTTDQPSYPQGHAGGAGTISGPGAGGAGTQSGMYPNQFSAPWYCYSNSAGNGGAWGQAGGASAAAYGSGCNGAGAYYPGGAGGYAVVGNANVTWSTVGTVYGPKQ